MRSCLPETTVTQSTMQPLASISRFWQTNRSIWVQSAPTAGQPLRQTKTLQSPPSLTVEIQTQLPQSEMSKSQFLGNLQPQRGYFLVRVISRSARRERSYSRTMSGAMVTMRKLALTSKMKSVRALSTGRITVSNLGTHSLLRSRAMMESEVLMKRTSGWKRLEWTAAGAKQRRPRRQRLRWSMLQMGLQSSSRQSSSRYTLMHLMCRSTAYMYLPVMEREEMLPAKLRPGTTSVMSLRLPRSLRKMVLQNWRVVQARRWWVCWVQGESMKVVAQLLTFPPRSFVSVSLQSTSTAQWSGVQQLMQVRLLLSCMQITRVSFLAPWMVSVCRKVMFSKGGGLSQLTLSCSCWQTLAFLICPFCVSSMRQVTLGPITYSQSSMRTLPGQLALQKEGGAQPMGHIVRLFSLRRVKLTCSWQVALSSVLGSLLQAVTVKLLITSIRSWSSPTWRRRLAWSKAQLEMLSSPMTMRQLLSSLRSMKVWGPLWLMTLKARVQVRSPRLKIHVQWQGRPSSSAEEDCRKMKRQLRKTWETTELGMREYLLSRRGSSRQVQSISWTACSLQRASSRWLSRLGEQTENFLNPLASQAPWYSRSSEAEMQTRCIPLRQSRMYISPRQILTSMMRILGTLRKDLSITPTIQGFLGSSIMKISVQVLSRVLLTIPSARQVRSRKVWRLCRSLQMSNLRCLISSKGTYISVFSFCACEPLLMKQQQKMFWQVRPLRSGRGLLWAQSTMMRFWRGKRTASKQVRLLAFSTFITLLMTGTESLLLRMPQWIRVRFADSARAMKRCPQPLPIFCRWQLLRPARGVSGNSCLRVRILLPRERYFSMSGVACREQSRLQPPKRESRLRVEDSCGVRGRVAQKVPVWHCGREARSVDSREARSTVRIIDIQPDQYKKSINSTPPLPSNFLPSLLSIRRAIIFQRVVCLDLSFIED